MIIQPFLLDERILFPKIIFPLFDQFHVYLQTEIILEKYQESLSKILKNNYFLTEMNRELNIAGGVKRIEIEKLM